MPKSKPATPQSTAQRKPLARGFNVMSFAQRRRIAAMGGRAVAKQRGSAHMSAIGARGGANSHKGDRGRGNGQ